MTMVYALVGAFLGGTIWHFGGALSGGLIGFLCGRVHELGNAQQGIREELDRMKKVADKHKPEERAGYQVASAPATKVSTPEPEPLELSESDLVIEQDELVRHEEQLSPLPVHRHEWVRYQPAEPEPPSPAEEWLRKLFSGENLLVKVGVVILFFGVSFLVKYAAQRGLFPLELRLTAAALGGCSLLGAGWRLRERRPLYAQVIQGEGIGILYLTTYAALHLYHLIPTGAGFFLLVTICGLSAFLAVAQDSRSLAVMGTAGGFLAPELASIGNGGPLLLFGYYAVLNAGILAIARLRAWRELQLLGFICTFIVSVLWGSRFYAPHHLLVVEPFLVMFFLLYTVLPVLNARLEETVLGDGIDCTLVFGTPIAAFALQSGLVRPYEYGLAWSALAAGCLYITLAKVLFLKDPERMRRLAEAYLSLGVVFGTLAIPLALDGRWTSAAWSIEGAALVWTGLRQDRRLARAFGYLLLVGSGLVFVGTNGFDSGVLPILNSSYIGCLLIIFPALLSGWLISRNRASVGETEGMVEPLLFAWGMAWWFVAGLIEVSAHTRGDLLAGAEMTFVSLSSFICSQLLDRLRWKMLEWPALALLPAMGCFTLLQVVSGSSYPSIHGGWFGWPVFIMSWYMILSRSRNRIPELPGVVHAAPFWLLALLASWEVSGRIMHHFPKLDTWSTCAWGVAPAVMVLLIARRGSQLPWPVRGNLATYLKEGSGPIAACAWVWVLYVNCTHAGNPWPLPYVPLINPLDGATLLVLTAITAWYRSAATNRTGVADILPPDLAGTGLASTIFVWLNALLLRSIHHWCGVPYTLDSLFSSLTVQSTLSIFWCLLALAVMIFATRKGGRHLWVAGAALLGVVVGKLFLVDLAGHGSVARIVSFVVVGLLILLIGWFSPVPPRAAGERVPS